MNDHELDRPVWGTLTTLQSRFAVGDERALRFVPEIGPLAAAVDDSPESLKALAQLVPVGESLILLQADSSPLPPGCVVERVSAGVQMMGDNLKPRTADRSIEVLTAADGPAMLALATLTQPGPFRTETHQLGTFWGVKHGARLVAMAGERMKLPGYTEVSGVCTHPDFRGRGYGAALSYVVAASIRDRGEVPFLHTYTANTAAISLYESLGFRLRRDMIVTVLAKAQG